MDIESKENIERNFWQTSEIESPHVDAIENIIFKMSEARVFLEKIKKFQGVFQKAQKILEIGGGQCWASCIVKNFFPQKRVFGSDIAPAAVASVGKWEHVFKVKLDGVFACKSYCIPVESNSLDCVFAYAAAHHFVKHRDTLKEIHRVLAPGGIALYLHEPACRSYIYRPALWRVNRKRPEVPEDVIVPKRLGDISTQVGLDMSVMSGPTLTNRAPFETLYYFVLNRVSFLQSILPCSVDIMFRKSHL